MMGVDGLTVDTADVRRSGDEIAAAGTIGATCRSSLADAMGGNTSGWQTCGQAGFTVFIETLRTQSERIRTELVDLGAALYTAADTYERHEKNSATRLTLDRSST